MMVKYWLSNEEIAEFSKNNDKFHLLGIFPVFMSMNELNEASNIAITSWSTLSPEQVAKKEGHEQKRY